MSGRKYERLKVRSRSGRTCAVEGVANRVDDAIVVEYVEQAVGSEDEELVNVVGWVERPVLDFGFGDQGRFAPTFFFGLDVLVTERSRDEDATMHPPVIHIGTRRLQPSRFRAVARRIVVL